MMMLEQFTVENFKAFKSLELNDLGHINIFVGDNNVGKTCLLEAMIMGLQLAISFIFSRNGEPLQPPLPLGIPLPSFIFSRNGEPLQHACFPLPFELNDSPDYLFHNNTDEQIVLTSIENISWSLGKIPNNKSGYILKCLSGADDIRYFRDPRTNKEIEKERSPINKQDLQEIPIKNLVYLRTASNFRKLSEYYYDGCINNDKEDYIVSLLKEVADKRLTKISYISDSRLRIGLAGMRNKYPLSFLGDGFPKLLAIASVLYSEDRQYLFIDEPENGFHYKTQTSFWKLLANWSLEGDKQSFIATHSYELISCLNDLLTADPTLIERGLKVRVHKLFRDENDPEKINVKTVDEKGLDWLLAHEMEIR